MDKIINESNYNGIYCTNQLIEEINVDNPETNQFFPGVVRLDVIPKSNWYIYVFRKERVVDEI
ncbi:MAG: hypothetical protein DI529_13030 [Chryseobacterium sp.]|nr:MAG: hypothetical protein DI529_13030 [Chryseobacterium sp.]